MEKDNQELLEDAKRNLKVAKEQLEEYGDSDLIDDATKKLFRVNYKNAKNNLALISDMANESAANVGELSAAVQNAEKAATEAKTPSDAPTTPVASSAQLPTEPASDDNVILPNHPEDQKIMIHFPDSSELRSAVSYSNAKSGAIIIPGVDKKSAEPAASSKKVSTREALREAAKQTFVGSKDKKTTKSKKKATNDSSMTREQYRKLHDKD